MNGKDFKLLLEKDGRSKDELAKLFGVNRGTLYDQFKLPAIPPFYIEKGQELGIVPQNKNQQNTTQGALSPKELAEYTDRLVKRITDQHNVAMEEMKRMLRVYESIMKKNKILN